MKVFWAFMAWLGVGITSLFVLTSITSSLSFLCFVLALIIIFPPLKGLLISKLPFLQKRLLKFLAWLILVITGMTFFRGFPAVSNLVVCTELQQDICRVETQGWVKNKQNLYLSGEQTNLDDGTEFTVIFKSKSDSQTETEVARQTVKANVQEETFLLELEPNNLPSGTYQLSLVNEDVTFPDSPVKELTLWDAEVENMVLCAQPQQDICLKETTAFVKNEPRIYLSGKHQQLKDGTEIIVNLSYFPEPEKKTKSESQIVKAKVKNQAFLLELKPKELPIGTYKLSVSSLEKIKFIDELTPQFTVWDSQQDVQARLSNKLPISNISLQELFLCDRTGLPLPEILKLSRPQLKSDNSPTDTEIVIEDPNFCPANSNQLPSKMKAIGLRLTFNNSEPENRLKMIWKYEGRIFNNQIVKLSGKVSKLYFILSDTRNFPKGNYELILASESRNSQPLYRKFSVK